MLHRRWRCHRQSTSTSLSSRSSDDDLDTSRILMKPGHGNLTNHHSESDDLDGEEAALHEFDFLCGDAATAASSNQYKSTGTGYTTAFHLLQRACLVFRRLETSRDEWNVDQSRLNRLKEEYKRDRHVKHQSITISNQTNALNNDSNTTSADQQQAFADQEQGTHSFAGLRPCAIVSLGNRKMVDTMIFRNSKNFIEENDIAGMDELSRVTVLNDNEPHYDVRVLSFTSSADRVLACLLIV